jgi:hypothetical protein
MDEKFSVAKLLGLSEEELEAIAPANPAPSVFPLKLRPLSNDYDSEEEEDKPEEKPDATITETNGLLIDGNDLSGVTDAIGPDSSCKESGPKSKVPKPPILGSKL